MPSYQPNQSETTKIAKQASKSSCADLYQQYETNQKLTWCSGCGNYSIQNALKLTLSAAGIKPQDAMLCFDVGCNGNGSDKIDCYTIHGLHGRVLSLAAGIALANPDLATIASAGDGATYSEGINHLVHAIRNDYPFTFIQHNNSVYGLTTGQASATTRKGFPMNSSPDGVIPDPINPAEVVLSLNPTFVARTFSGDVQHMAKTFHQALNHPGFAFVEVLQVCPTYNKATSQEWYWEHLQDVKTIKNYDHTDIWQAKQAATDMENKINIGLLYQNKQPGFLKRLVNRKNWSTTLVNEVSHFNITPLLKEFE